MWKSAKFYFIQLLFSGWLFDFSGLALPWMSAVGVWMAVPPAVLCNASGNHNPLLLSWLSFVLTVSVVIECANMSFRQYCAVACISTMCLHYFETFNSLAPRGFDYSLKLINFKLISTINIWSIILWNCYQVNVTIPHWSLVNIG